MAKALWIPFLAGGTTIFVIFVAIRRSKFAKGVVGAVRGQWRVRQQKIINAASRDLWHHARMVAVKKEKYMEYLLKHKGMDATQKIGHLPTLKAARTGMENERIQAKRCWDVLEKHEALPVDPLTKGSWRTFDDFLDRVHESDAVYA